jgi:hypothetical protein
MGIVMDGEILAESANPREAALDLYRDWWERNGRSRAAQ